MLNYVAALVLNYLIFDSLSYWRDQSADGPRLPAGQDARRRGERGRSRRSASVTIPFGFLVAVAVAVLIWVLVRADAIRLRGAGDRRLAARRPLRGDADAAQDRGDHVPVGRDRGDRRREPDGRLPPRARRARAAAGELRLHGHRRRGARSLQPVRGRASPRFCSAGCRTPATRCRARTSPRGSSASCRG